jgi:hypothetical protein
MNNPTPKMSLPWSRNPSYDGGAMPPMLVGDRVLVAVPLYNGKYDFHLLIVQERWFEKDGEYWTDWDWDDVEWYIPLDGHRTEEDDSW